MVIRHSGGFLPLTPVLDQSRERLHPTVAPVVEGILFLALLLGTVIAVSKSRVWILSALLLALPAVVLWLVGTVVASSGVVVMHYLFLGAFLGNSIWVMLRAIFDTRQVTFNTVCASLCIYILAGIVWALAYSLIDVLDPAAFTYTVVAGKRPSLLWIGRGDTAVPYFSFSTLTTLGYGDIVPTSPISRMLASTEAIAGQLYLAVLVARLVSMHIVYSMGSSR
jgi:hypothetical protein